MNGTECAERPLVYSVAECASLLKISRTNAYSLIQEGRIKAVRLRGRLLVPSKAVDELLDTAGR